ncbi:uncharacterized protein TNCV_3919221 [Trichonephila clavipes]|nr:uncharacterized protein TNCV_3919221 [Trichonephila clavipes]
MDPFIYVEERLNAQRYLSVTADQAHPVMLMVEFNLLISPAQSPDPNPIENPWDQIEQGIMQLDRIPPNLKHEIRLDSTLDITCAVPDHVFLFFCLCTPAISHVSTGAEENINSAAKKWLPMYFLKFTYRPREKLMVMGSLVDRASDSRPEGLGSMPLPPNTFQVHTEYVLVKSLGPKVLWAESRVQGTGEYFPPLQFYV